MDDSDMGRWTYGAGPAGPHAVTSTSSGLDLTYDANGNLLRQVDRTSGAIVSDLTYDAENRLVQVTSAPTAPQTITLHLATGWNFVSLPVAPANQTLSALFGAELAKVQQVSRVEMTSQTCGH